MSKLTLPHGASKEQIRQFQAQLAALALEAEKRRREVEGAGGGL
jgi:hypothetical protein